MLLFSSLWLFQFPPSGPLVPDVRLLDRDDETEGAAEPELPLLPGQSRVQVCEQQHSHQHSVELFIRFAYHLLSYEV